MAQQFAEWIRSSDEFDLVAPAPLNLVCFAHKNGNDFNRELLETINKNGKMYFTHTVVKDQYVLRMCIAQTHTTEEHVRKAWENIQKTAADLTLTDPK